ncbi:flagellar hook-basal body complex protein FliE [Clostridium sp.]|uniref:flagellar hook-basal body complex protein FliE n=1 Tax=Clostridium sp. TaxID=1506 RepID=UPI003991D3C4
MNISSNPYLRINNLNNNLFLNKVVGEKIENKSSGFKDILVEQLNKVNEKQIEADILTEKIIRGDSDVSIHEVMLAGEEANMSLQLAVQVRNKLLEAFQEISRTQI